MSEKRAEIWKQYLAKPKYAVLGTAYTIKFCTPPTVNPDNKDQMIIQTDKGRIILWYAQFQQLLQLAETENFKDFAIMFNREENSNRRVIVKVSEELPQ